MGASRSSKTIKTTTGIRVTEKESRTKAKAANYRTMKPSWNLGFLDLSYKWSFHKVVGDNVLFRDVYSKLCFYETMTWQVILQANGGKSHGSNNHEIPIERLIPEAQKRLEELHLNDIDSLFSLRLTGKQRVWGILDGSVLKLLWLDMNHEICPSIK
mgnify:CR=1 FL=1